MPLTKLSVNMTLKNQGVYAQMGKRVEDLRPVWNEILVRWLEHNEDKFELARGASATGVTFDTEGGPVVWLPLTPGYLRSKTRAGYDDWLMVRDGELKRSLTRRDSFGWFEDLRKDGAEFGTILMTATYHEETRPVMFLDAEDRVMIREVFGAWMNSDPPFTAPPWTGAVIRKVIFWEVATTIAFRMIFGYWSMLGVAIDGIKAYRRYRRMGYTRGQIGYKAYRAAGPAARRRVRAITGR